MTQHLDGPFDAAAEARALLADRRRRARYLPAQFVTGAAWMMLLELLVADVDGVQLSTSSLCLASGVAPTTALRWIDRLLEAKLAVRSPDPRDQRRAFIGISGEGKAALLGYFALEERAERAAIVRALSPSILPALAARVQAISVEIGQLAAAPTRRWRLE